MMMFRILSMDTESNQRSILSTPSCRYMKSYIGNCFVWAVVLLGFFWAPPIWSMHGLEPAAQTDQASVTSDSLTWYTMQQAQQLAEEEDKHVLIFMEAVWCGYCKRMKKEVFPLPEIQQVLSKYYYPVKLDVESRKEIVFNGQPITERQFSQKIEVQATPTLLFLNSKGEIMGRQPGFIPAEIFEPLLTYVATDAFHSQSFDTYLEKRQN
jgi:thioredoxin-related protein